MQKATRSAYQTITVQVLGPTNTKGTRVKASCEAGSVVLPWDHTLGVNDNTNRAVRRLLKKIDWHGHWQGGDVGKKVVYVCVCGG